MTSPWDVLVIGGGVVGAAIAREFAASGKRVLLCEKEDEVFLFCLTRLFRETTRSDENKSSQVLSGASGANTGHFASFFYYTRYNFIAIVIVIVIFIIYITIIRIY